MVLSEALFSVFFNLSFFHAILSLVSFPASFTFLPSPQSCPTRPIKNQVFLPDGPPPLLLHEVSSPLSPTGINYDDLFMPPFPLFPFSRAVAKNTNPAQRTEPGLRQKAKETEQLSARGGRKGIWWKREGRKKTSERLPTWQWRRRKGRARGGP